MRYLFLILNFLIHFMKNNKSLVVWMALLLILATNFLYGCNLGNQAELQNVKKLDVAASFYPLYFFATEIGGDKVSAVNITPAGAEPHEYEPTPQEILKIENSDLLILNGAGLEPWGESIIENLQSASSKTKLVAVSNDLADQKFVEEGETMVDPHVWLSPSSAIKVVDNIERAFADVDSVNAEYYLFNATKLKQSLQDLDTDYRGGLKNCERKDFITSHAAFGYLSTAYGLNQVPIDGLSPEAEPSAKELADISKFAKDHNAQYIFFESLVSPKLAQTVATEVGAQVMVLNPIEGLTDEELVEGKNYLTEMKANLDNLKTALGCK